MIFFITRVIENYQQAINYHDLRLQSHNLKGIQWIEKLKALQHQNDMTEQG